MGASWVVKYDQYIISIFRVGPTEATHVVMGSVETVSVTCDGSHHGAAKGAPGSPSVIHGHTEDTVHFFRGTIPANDVQTIRSMLYVDDVVLVALCMRPDGTYERSMFVNVNVPENNIWVVHDPAPNDPVDRWVFKNVPQLQRQQYSLIPAPCRGPWSFPLCSAIGRRR